MSGKKSRTKGYRGEHNLEKLLKQNGIEAYRIPLSGGDKFIKGDLYIPALGEYCEVKVRKKLNNLFYEALEKSNIAFFKADRKDYFVVMKLDYFIKLCETIPFKAIKHFIMNERRQK